MGAYIIIFEWDNRNDFRLYYNLGEKEKVTSFNQKPRSQLPQPKYPRLLLKKVIHYEKHA